MHLARESRSMYATLADELDADIDFHPSGGMVAIETGAHRAFMETFISAQRAAGIRVELLDGDSARQRQPELAPHVLGASYSPDDAEVDPLALNAALVDAAVRAGVHVRRHCEFLAITRRGDRIESVETSTGSITCRLVINSAGPYAGVVGDRAGVRTPIRPRRGTILISEPQPKMVAGNLLCAQYVASKHLGALPGGTEPRHGIGLSLGQTASGTLLIGGSREFAGFDKRPSLDVLAHIASHASRIVPALKDVRIIRAMTGLRPYTGDGLPIIGRAPEVEGWITAAGHEGDGIALAPITGVLVRDLVTGERTTGDFLPHLSGDRDTLPAPPMAEAPSAGSAPTTRRHTS
ncbi:sarcosine oxidase subunit beta [Brevibacterium casei CIP 102111]|nr:sarcosine oxidase subunit beta [Brevibacterium casei CIP 102111]VEW11492.1 Glycine oxidase [Brevibacterium casei]